MRASFARIVGSSQHIHNREGWSVVRNIGTDCFIFSISSQIHAQFIITEIVTEIEMGYRILSKKNFYFNAPEHLLRRLLSVGKKRLAKLQKRYPQSDAEIGVVLVSPYRWWVGITGNLAAFSIVNDDIRDISKNAVEKSILNGKIRVAHSIYSRGESLVLCTESILQNVPLKTVLEILKNPDHVNLRTELLVQKAVQRRMESAYGAVQITV